MGVCSSEHVYPLIGDELATEWTQIIYSADIMIKEDFLVDPSVEISLALSKDQ